MKRVAIYLRVSTDKQTTDNQRRELEGVAARSGWQVIQIYKDEGVSGAKGRDKRPGLDAMMKGVNRKEFDMVAAWSVDRLGRSLTDLLSILQGLHEKGVGLFLHQQGLDTTTTAGIRCSAQSLSFRTIPNRKQSLTILDNEFTGIEECLLWLAFP